MNDPPATSQQSTHTWPPPDDRPLERDGRSPVERHALARLSADVAAMPASDIVQLVLWPQTLADWARDVAVATAVVYNLLAGVKPYRRVRELLALRLESPPEVLDHLVDAPRPLPSAMRAPDSATAAIGPQAHRDPAPPPPPPPPSADEWRRSGRSLPNVRDGSNPLEQRAVFHAWRNVAALPASLLIQLAIFPETLAAWARRRSVPASMLYATLAGSHRNARIRDALARQLDVSTAALDHIIQAPRHEPAAPATIPLADAPPPTGEHVRTLPPGEPPAPRSQLSLEL